MPKSAWSLGAQNRTSRAAFAPTAGATDRGLALRLQLLVLRFFDHDRVLFAISQGDTERKEDRVGNPDQPSVRIWQCDEQGKENKYSDPTHRGRPDHEAAFAWPVGVPNAEVGADDPTSQTNHAPSDCSDPSPHCACAHFMTPSQNR